MFAVWSGNLPQKVPALSAKPPIGHRMLGDKLGCQRMMFLPGGTDTAKSPLKLILSGWFFNFSG